MSGSHAWKGKGHNGRDRGRGQGYRLAGWRKGRISVARARSQPSPDAALPPRVSQASQGDCPAVHPTKGVQCGFPVGHGGAKHYRRQGSNRISWPIDGEGA